MVRATNVTVRRKAKPLTSARTENLSPGMPGPGARHRPTGGAAQQGWSRMVALEASMAADRDDPNFDYAAN
jgi:hypothetical protein